MARYVEESICFQQIFAHNMCIPLIICIIASVCYHFKHQMYNTKKENTVFIYEIGCLPCPYYLYIITVSDEVAYDRPLSNYIQESPS